MLEEFGTLSIASLAERLMVSAETVRRDVRALSEIGEVHRVHGGASLPATLGESPFRKRMRENAAAKQSIARALAAMIRNGDTFMLDTGTTTSYLARALIGHSRLSVITNSTDAARILVGGAGNRVFLAGGQLRPDSGAILGEEALEYIERHSAQYAVISAGAVRDGEVMDFDTGEAILARKMLSRSDRGILVTDATKFGKRGLAAVCHCSALDEIVTDAPVSPSEARVIEEAGVALTVAGEVARS
jgi:DeoR family glycerol-3-phosphate regulon repressor